MATLELCAGSPVLSAHRDRQLAWHRSPNRVGATVGAELIYGIHPVRATCESERSGRSFSFDSERISDGTYFFKLEASDSLSNPEDIYLSTVKISDSFDIDNTGPQILDISIKKNSSQITLSFTAKDQYNPIKEISYSIDGKAWKTVYPIDRICDSKTEKFNITTKLHAVGSTHSIVIKAIDSINNIGFGRKNF